MLRWPGSRPGSRRAGAHVVRHGHLLRCCPPPIVVRVIRYGLSSRVAAYSFRACRGRRGRGARDERGERTGRGTAGARRTRGGRARRRAPGPGGCLRRLRALGRLPALGRLRGLRRLRRLGRRPRRRRGGVPRVRYVAGARGRPLLRVRARGRGRGPADPVRGGGRRRGLRSDTHTSVRDAAGAVGPLARAHLGAAAAGGARCGGHGSRAGFGRVRGARAAGADGAVRRGGGGVRGGRRVRGRCVVRGQRRWRRRGRRYGSGAAGHGGRHAGRALRGSRAPRGIAARAPAHVVPRRADADALGLALAVADRAERPGHLALAYDAPRHGVRRASAVPPTVLRPHPAPGRPRWRSLRTPVPPKPVVPLRGSRRRRLLRPRDRSGHPLPMGPRRHQRPPRHLRPHHPQVPGVRDPVPLRPAGPSRGAPVPPLPAASISGSAAPSRCID
ncbi:hypothetical protein STRAU_6810 [Streptomyces aurantiacus JA 4570]|uniref:Uncharacterized protein n=1 Tax=Streptomyces aurantiacus JA 4570 TaxID=1286094 RepID=S3ZAJ9_9ACTN|nr:hypothetical protein STRAU_6810 [Streptomyces aurantiacus JA 4570]